MDFDKVLEEIGEFGYYQKINYLLICLPVMFAAANSFTYIFTAGIPNYRCSIPECEQNLEPQYNENWLKNAIPGTVDINGNFIPDQCYRFMIRPINISSNSNNNYNSLSLNEYCPADMFMTNKEIRCNNWIYDNEETTIVNAWNITCNENAWKLALVGTMHFAGLVVGTCSSGFLADRFGRKLIFIISIIFMSITGVLQGMAWNYHSFLTFAFLNAIGTAGVYPLAFILCVEMVGPNKREMSAMVLNYFYAIGEALVGLLAWLCRDWQLLQYVLSAPPLLFTIYYWFVPESVRWLIAKEDHEKASKIIKKAARINRKELSDSLLKSFDLINTTTSSDNYSIDHFDEDGNKLNSKNNDDIKINNNSNHKNEILNVFWDVLKSKILIWRYIALFYIWAVNAFVFYGLSLNSTNLSGNKYMNFALVCLIEIPGYSMAWICLHKFGRRWSLSGSLLLCGITCIAGGFVEHESTGENDIKNSSFTWAIVTLFLIGKLGITSSFAVIYAYTAEMTPTIIRTGGVGVMSTVARCGAMVAPFVPLLGIYYKPLPLLLFGSVSFSAGLLALSLPETFRQKLPDTVKEAEKIGRKEMNILNFKVGK